MADSHSSRDKQFEAAVAAHGHQFARIARVYADRDSEDLLQEMLLQIWRSLPSFNGESEVGTWCYRVAMNTALMWRRSAGRRIATRQETVVSGKNESELNQQPAAEAASEQKQQSQLREFLATLSDLDQAVLLMHLANRTSAETAEALAISDGAIRTRLSRLRTKLREWGDLHV